jgi:hypothetical protein
MSQGIFIVTTQYLERRPQMIAKGKHELKTHIPIRTYQLLKNRAEGHGIGQLIADAMDCYANLGKLTRQVETQGNQIEHILRLLEARDADTQE